MKTRTRAPIKMTAAGTAAKQQELRKESYREAKTLSSWKLLIGGLLLFGDKSQDVFWPFFEATLRQYIDLRLGSKSRLEQQGQANGGQPD